MSVSKVTSVPAGDGLNIKKDEDFSKWYWQVITKTHLIDTCDLSGFYILLPNTMDIWDNLRKEFDAIIKQHGVRNAYFPLFVPESALTKEKHHIKGFSPEVAWVTKTGNEDLEEKLAVRPTSETIIYPLYAKWIKTYRDLPMKRNSWCNVVRWEFKHAIPFIRSREFLWQEGHSAFVSSAEADDEVSTMCNVYKHVYEDILAVPVIQGKKTEYEKFGGAKYTLTCECYIPDANRAVQAATAHHLGDNFSRMFGIKYVDSNNQEQFVHQTSWGFTTRSIGIMIMTHGDNKGLILPPRVAPINVVIIPHLDKNGIVSQAANNINKLLQTDYIRSHLDNRTDYRAGYKFAEWELNGVPLRLELGLKELNSNTIKAVRRDNGESTVLNMDNLVDDVEILLQIIQHDMLEKARGKLQITKVYSLESLYATINSGGMGLAPHCDTKECETSIIGNGIKSLCKPFIQDPIQGNCCNCDDKAVTWTLFGKSY